MSMVVFALSLAQAVREGPSLPMAAFEPLSSYMSCLFDRPDDAGGLPPSAAAREVLVEAVIDACKPVRAQSAAAAEAMLAADAHYSNPRDRRAAIEGLLAAWEQRLRLQILEREAFLQADRDEENQ
jgi:hypothetical protein